MTTTEKLTPAQKAVATRRKRQAQRDLLTAAPDMLEAMEAFIRATSSFHKLQLCKQPRCELCAAITGAARVIAQAKGAE